MTYGFVIVDENGNTFNADAETYFLYTSENFSLSGGGSVTYNYPALAGDDIAIQLFTSTMEVYSLQATGCTALVSGTSVTVYNTCPYSYYTETGLLYVFRRGLTL